MAGSTSSRKTDPTSPEPIEAHARAAARLAGLTIEEAWWPGVIAHLRVLIEQARLVERHRGTDRTAPAPTFEP